MVHIVEDWAIFADHAEHVRTRYYREMREMDDRVTVRAVAGRLGFEGEYEKEGKALAEIRDFLDFHEFVKVSRSVDVDVFLR